MAKKEKQVHPRQLTRTPACPYGALIPTPKFGGHQSANFRFFCMIPSEKGSVFGDFWYVTSKKIPQKSPFCSRSRDRVSVLPASEQHLTSNKMCSDTERWIWLYDKQDKYLAKPSFLLRPIFFSSSPPSSSASSRVRLFRDAAQFDKSIDRFDNFGDGKA